MVLLVSYLQKRRREKNLVLRHYFILRMATKNRIVVGCRVQAKVGPFLDDHRIISTQINDQEVEPSSKRVRGIRRARTLFHGTVISSTPDLHWRVYWDEIGKTSDHTSTNLNILSTSTVVDVDLDLLRSWNENQEIYIGKHQAMMLYTKDMRKKTTVSTVISPPLPPPTPPHLQPPSNNRNTSSELPGPNLPPLEDICEEDDEDDDDENLINEKELQRQFLEEEKTNKYIQMKETYKIEKSSLIELNETVDVKGPGQLITTWTVVGDVKQVDVPVRKERHDFRGISGFDFNHKNVKSKNGSTGRVNLHDLFIHMWGDDDNNEKELCNMNKFANKRDPDNITRHTRSLPTSVKPFSRKELWIGWGLVLTARLLNTKCGENMWRKNDKADEKTVTNMIPAFDPRPFMSLSRFRQWKSAVAWTHSNESLKDEDPWWRIIGVINSWNANRTRTICASTTTVLDETMSAFRPQTTSTGNLPHLSYILRKPEPLGTELKVSMCTELQIMKHLFLCRKKDDKTNVSKYETETKKKTAQVSLELMSHSIKTNQTENELRTQELFLGDAWFSSIDLAILTKTEHNSNYIGVVKTNHSRYPKKFLEKTMSKWPSGSYLNLTSTIDGVKLFATGYKYCNRKALMFLWTDGAGNTEPGSPYEATWIDNNGNRSVRFIERPSVISCYFERSNKIDVSNQMRQFELRLEKIWVTNCGYFRLLTTLIGCNVVDCWRGYRHHCRHQHRHKHIDLLDFTSLLAYDMLHNDITDDVDVSHNINVALMNHSNPASSSSTPPLHYSSILTNTETTNSSSSRHIILDRFAQFCLEREVLHEQMIKRHELIRNTTNLERDNSVKSCYRVRRALCIAPGCKKKTSTYCEACDRGSRNQFWVCKDHYEWHTQKYMQKQPFKE